MLEVWETWSFKEGLPGVQRKEQGWSKWVTYKLKAKRLRYQEINKQRYIGVPDKNTIFMKRKKMQRESE